MTYLLSSAYLAPVHYYTKLYSGFPIVEEHCDHYIKQTYRNRCIIAASDGPLALTIPVEGRPKSEGGTSKTPMRDIRISNHGRWHALHWHALVSAYENSPYFEFYADDFEEIYRKPCTFLVDFNAALQQLVLDLLNLRPNLRINADHYLDVPAGNLPPGSSLAALPSPVPLSTCANASAPKSMPPSMQNSAPGLTTRCLLRATDFSPISPSSTSSLIWAPKAASSCVKA